LVQSHNIFDFIYVYDVMDRQSILESLRV
jgi:hypothetical protein